MAESTLTRKGEKQKGLKLGKGGKFAKLDGAKMQQFYLSQDLHFAAGDKYHQPRTTTAQSISSSYKIDPQSIQSSRSNAHQFFKHRLKNQSVSSSIDRDQNRDRELKLPDTQTRKLRALNQSIDYGQSKPILSGLDNDANDEEFFKQRPRQLATIEVQEPQRYSSKIERIQQQQQQEIRPGTSVGANSVGYRRFQGFRAASVDQAYSSEKPTLLFQRGDERQMIQSEIKIKDDRDLQESIEKFQDMSTQPPIQVKLPYYRYSHQNDSLNNQSLNQVASQVTQEFKPIAEQLSQFEMSFSKNQVQSSKGGGVIDNQYQISPGTLKDIQTVQDEEQTTPMFTGKLSVARDLKQVKTKFRSLDEDELIMSGKSLPSVSEESKPYLEEKQVFNFAESNSREEKSLKGNQKKDFVPQKIIISEIIEAPSPPKMVNSFAFVSQVKKDSSMAGFQVDESGHNDIAQATGFFRQNTQQSQQSTFAKKDMERKRIKQYESAQDNHLHMLFSNLKISYIDKQSPTKINEDDENSSSNSASSKSIIKLNESLKDDVRIQDRKSFGLDKEKYRKSRAIRDLDESVRSSKLQTPKHMTSINLQKDLGNEDNKHRREIVMFKQSEDNKAEEVQRWKQQNEVESKVLSKKGTRKDLNNSLLNKYSFSHKRHSILQIQASKKTSSISPPSHGASTKFLNLQLTKGETGQQRRGSIVRQTTIRNSEGAKSLTGQLMQTGELQITPELAAQIVKQYIVPMFTEKRIDFNRSTSKYYPSKAKYAETHRQIQNNRSSSFNESALDENSGRRTSSQDQSNSKKQTRLLSQSESANYLSVQNSNAKKTVLSEIQLNQELYEKLTQTQSELKSATEELEETHMLLMNKERGYQSIRRENARLQIQNRLLKKRVEKMAGEEIATVSHNLNLQRQYENLLNLLATLERKRKQVNQQLSEETSQKDKAQNQCKQLQTELNLIQNQFWYLKHEYQLILGSVSELSKYKMLQDQHEVSLLMIQRQLEKAVIDRREAESQIISYIDKNDVLTLDMKRLLEHSKEVQQVKDQTIKALKEKNFKLEQNLKELQDSYVSLKNLEIVNESNLNKAIVEISVLKKRIEKLKVRKVKLNQKICKYCNQEFVESENYNWSCRTHQSDYGGEMWWCCGQKSKEAPGCKFNKHINKEDEEQDQQDLENNGQHSDQLRCFCCKSLGHSGTECPRDPNLRTLQASADLPIQIEIDEQRVHKIQTEMSGSKRVTYLEDFRKYLTTLIKQEQEQIGAVTMTDQNKPVRTGEVIQTRLLEFDDYNYTQINEELERGAAGSILTNKGGESKLSKDLLRSREGVTVERMHSFKERESEQQPTHIQQIPQQLTQRASSLSIDKIQGGDEGNSVQSFTRKKLSGMSQGYDESPKPRASVAGGQENMAEYLNEDLAGVIQLTDEQDLPTLLPRISFDIDKAKLYQQRKLFDDIEQLKFEVQIKQNAFLESNLINIMSYLPKRYTPTSSMAKSSRAGSTRGGPTKSALDRHGTLMSSIRQGGPRHLLSPGRGGGGDDPLNSSSILLTSFNHYQNPHHKQVVGYEGRTSSRSLLHRDIVIIKEGSQSSVIPSGFSPSAQAQPAQQRLQLDREASSSQKKRGTEIPQFQESHYQKNEHPASSSSQTMAAQRRQSRSSLKLGTSPTGVPLNLTLNATVNQQDQAGGGGQSSSGGNSNSLFNSISVKSNAQALTNASLQVHHSGSQTTTNSRRQSQARLVNQRHLNQTLQDSNTIQSASTILSMQPQTLNISKLGEQEGSQQRGAKFRISLKQTQVLAQGPRKSTAMDARAKTPKIQQDSLSVGGSIEEPSQSDHSSGYSDSFSNSKGALTSTQMTKGQPSKFAQHQPGRRNSKVNFALGTKI